jgi:hypothetical protein
MFISVIPIFCRKILAGKEKKAIHMRKGQSQKSFLQTKLINPTFSALRSSICTPCVYGFLLIHYFQMRRSYFAICDNTQHELCHVIGSYGRQCSSCENFYCHESWRINASTCFTRHLLVCPDKDKHKAKLKRKKTGSKSKKTRGKRKKKEKKILESS